MYVAGAFDCGLRPEKMTWKSYRVIEPYVRSLKEGSFLFGFWKGSEEDGENKVSS